MMKKTKDFDVTSVASAERKERKNFINCEGRINEIQKSITKTKW